MQFFTSTDNIKTTNTGTSGSMGFIFSNILSTGSILWDTDRFGLSDDTKVYGDLEVTGDITGNIKDVTYTDLTVAGSLDMTGGADQWFRPPQMTSTQRNTMTGGWGASEAGRMWFNSDTSQFEGWDGNSIVIIG